MRQEQGGSLKRPQLTSGTPTPSFLLLPPWQVPTQAIGTWVLLVTSPAHLPQKGYMGKHRPALPPMTHRPPKKNHMNTP